MPPTFANLGSDTPQPFGRLTTMTRRKSKSKRAAVNQKQIAELSLSTSTETKGSALDKMEQLQANQSATEKPAYKAAADTINESTKCLALNKRLRAEDGDEISGYPRKRVKSDGNSHQQHYTATTKDLADDATARVSPVQDLSSTRIATTQSPPLEVQQLQNKYEYTTMSIISSSKIEQKVRNLLLRLSPFDLTDMKAKPGIVVLHAKAEIASKMVSIVEIAKREIQKDQGKWYQYSRLHGEIAKLKKKQAMRREGGKTNTQWDKEKSATKAADEAAEKRSDGVEEVHQENEAVDDEENEMEDAFETMVAPIRDVEERKVRAIPVMTIYFARVPVPGMKELYGYG